MAQRIGVDVGGTNVKIALVSDKGKIIYYGTLDELKDKYKKKDLEQLFMEVIEDASH